MNSVSSGRRMGVGFIFNRNDLCCLFLYIDIGRCSTVQQVVMCFRSPVAQCFELQLTLATETILIDQFLVDLEVSNFVN